MARILVIDDNEDFRQILLRFVESQGHTVFEAADADTGLQIFIEQKVDLVISDLMMPVKTGMDLLYELRKTNPKLLFIMVTGYPSEESAAQAAEAGAYDYLAKPLDMNQLKAVMQRALSAVELRSKLSAVRGLNIALWISIPIWVILGILIRIFLFQ